MTSGGDTNNDVTDACKQSTKNRKGYTPAILHVKPLKNNWLTEIALALERQRKTVSVQFSAGFALSSSNNIPQALDSEDRRRANSLSSLGDIADLLGHTSGSYFDLSEAFLGGLFLQTG